MHSLHSVEVKQRFSFFLYKQPDINDHKETMLWAENIFQNVKAEFPYGKYIGKWYIDMFKIFKVK